MRNINYPNLLPTENNLLLINSSWLSSPFKLVGQWFCLVLAPLNSCLQTLTGNVGFCSHKIPHSRGSAGGSGCHPQSWEAKVRSLPQVQGIRYRHRYNVPSAVITSYSVIQTPPPPQMEMLWRLPERFYPATKSPHPPRTGPRAKITRQGPTPQPGKGSYSVAAGARHRNQRNVLWNFNNNLSSVETESASHVRPFWFSEILALWRFQEHIGYKRNGSPIWLVNCFDLLPF